MNKVFFGDCRESMKALIADGVKVQTCVTSPPYWNLRDYEVDGQLGHEPCPEKYIANLVEAFGLVRDLLAGDGTLWLNLGDSYLKKNLLGLPWRVALALSADGWYLRQDIIWHKPSPMPESVKDRCTKSHEYIFLLSKSPKYYFDHEAIKEPAIYGNKGSQFDTGKTGQHQQGRASKKRGEFNGKTNAMPGRESFRAIKQMRHKRDVWTVPTKPYKGAHFAVFPPDLITPCIKAGSKPGDIVFDPFFGSGTTGQVAQQYGRRWIGCELNSDYRELQEARTNQQSLTLTPPTEDMRK
jgi:DNA modification methylase